MWYGGETFTIEYAVRFKDDSFISGNNQFEDIAADVAKELREETKWIDV